jgi:hypothetical protein
MTVLWEKIKKNIVSTISETIDKTEELTSVGRIKLEILQFEHKLDEKYAEFGKIFYKNFSRIGEKTSQNKKYLDVKHNIDELEKKLREKEKELGRIREKDGIDFDS